MKTHSLERFDFHIRQSAKTFNSVDRLNRALCLASKLFVAVVPALAIIVGAAWLTSAPELMIYLQATLWTFGFVFMGLALESQKATIFASIATGIALPVLAMLSSRVAPDFAIVAAAVLAVWVAVGIFRR